LDRRLCLKGNGLGLKKTRKIYKPRKKVQNSFGGTPVFLQNTPLFRPKTALVKTHNLQVADGQRLSIRHFRSKFTGYGGKAGQPRNTRKTRKTETIRVVGVVRG
jgi:hypothetical protein